MKKLVIILSYILFVTGCVFAMFKAYEIAIYTIVVAIFVKSED